MPIHNFLSIGSSMHPLKLKAGTNILYTSIHSPEMNWRSIVKFSLVCKISNQIWNHADDWSESVGFLDWRFFLNVSVSFSSSSCKDRTHISFALMPSFLVPNVLFLCFRITWWNLLKVRRKQSIQEKRLSYCTMVYYCTISLSLLNLLLLISKLTIGMVCILFSVSSKNWVVLEAGLCFCEPFYQDILIILGQISGHSL
jgi:hypothetical protein